MALSSTATIPPSVLPDRAPLPTPTIIFDPKGDYGLWLQAFCLNPPPESCGHGSCPNPDVTGTGQQVSIYIISITFAISLAYCPQLIRPTLYAHLGLIYSSLIASLASALSGQLTRNDAVSVLVNVASPGSFALWTLTLCSLWRPSRFPVQKTKPKSVEILILKLASLGSLIFEFGMVCAMLIPSSRFVSKFSQPACTGKHAGGTWVLFWLLPYSVQFSWVVVLIGISCLLSKGLQKKRLYLTTTVPTIAEYEWETWRSEAQRDVVTWTETSLSRISCLSMPVGSLTMRSILAAIQLCALPNILYFINQNVLTVILLIAPVFDHSPGSYRRRAILAGRLFATPFVASVYGIDIFIWDFRFNIGPTCSDALLTLVCAIIFWRKSFYQRSRSMKDFILALWFTISLVAALGGNGIALLYMTYAGYGPLIDPPTPLSLQPLKLNILVLPFWFLSWLATAVWSVGITITPANMWRAVMLRAHILRTGLFVITPNSLWVQASLATSPVRSTNMTFGQIFTLLVSVVAVLPLIEATANVKRDVWKAFFYSEKMPVNNTYNVQPNPP